MSDGLTGLRIDVCTFQGCREGLPALLDLLRDRGISASIFVAMGPDRSGLAVRRFLRPGFLSKMVRSRAIGLYGWRTALYGTLLPAPRIAERCAEIIRRAVREGHEVGVHSWDHARWQDRLDRLSRERVLDDYSRALDAFKKATGAPPDCAAAPAWFTNSTALCVQNDLPLRYASDCKGRGPFQPVVDGRPLRMPQVPSTLPSLDEVLGTGGVTAGTFHERVFRALKSGSPNVHTIHAEAEGRVHRASFEEFLDRAIAEGLRFVSLHRFLDANRTALPMCPIVRGCVPGRAGAVSLQGKPLPCQ